MWFFLNLWWGCGVHFVQRVELTRNGHDVTVYMDSGMSSDE